jgi:hypothetical protein
MAEMIGKKMAMGFLVISFLVAGKSSFAQETAETVEDAFKNGKISGTIGSYFEYVEKDAQDADYGWATGYLTLKYETARWNDLLFGARFFAHGQMYSDHEDGTTDPFDADIESQYTLPELYLDYGFAEASRVRAGRWDHQDITHIDDNQSEGVYVQFKEMEDVELVTGIMRRFAEIDYDDGEDFGRNNDAQDLDSEATFGPGSGAYLYFLEGKYHGIDMVTLNPYMMFHNDYASVYGIDTKFETQLKDSEVTLGAEADYYHVNAEIAGSSDANNYRIAPFVKIKPVYASVGYARFDDGDSLTKPAWLRDYFLPVDQLITYGTPDSNVVFGKVKLTLGDFWSHFAFADSDYQTTAGRGDGSQEYELQFGYQLTKNLDANLRLFDVQYDNVDNKDYQKVESRVRFKF